MAIQFFLLSKIWLIRIVQPRMHVCSHPNRGPKKLLDVAQLAGLY